MLTETRTTQLVDLKKLGRQIARSIFLDPYIQNADWGIFTSDVVAAVVRFKAQAQFFQKLDFLLPCAVFGNDPTSVPIPIDLYEITALESITSKEVTWDDLVLPIAKSLRKEGLDVKPFRIKEAYGFFESRFSDFLSARVSLREALSPNDPQNLGYLPFCVKTRRRGLRVHYAPTYSIKYNFESNPVFGSPTSPVYGWIRPGQYIFGAVSEKFGPKWDAGHYDIPPTTEAVLVSI